MPQRRLNALEGGATTTGAGAAPALPTAPAWLTGQARDIWDRLAPHVPAGRLTAATADQFAMLCTSLATYIEADQAVAAGVLIAAGQDLIPNPALPVRNIADTQVARWAKAFGLAPDDTNHQPARGGMRHLREA